MSGLKPAFRSSKYSYVIKSEAGEKIQLMLEKSNHTLPWKRTYSPILSAEAGSRPFSSTISARTSVQNVWCSNKRSQMFQEVKSKQ